MGPSQPCRAYFPDCFPLRCVRHLSSLQVSPRPLLALIRLGRWEHWLRTEGGAPAPGRLITTPCSSASPPDPGCIPTDHSARHAPRSCAQVALVTHFLPLFLLLEGGKLSPGSLSSPMYSLPLTFRKLLYERIFFRINGVKLCSFARTLTVIAFRD